MSFQSAVEIVRGWPLDKTAPARLAAAIESAEGLEKAQMALLVEALVVAAETPEDLALIQEHFE
jgi:hypothetical protein